MKTRNLLASILLAAALADCSAADVVIDGLSHTTAVAIDLEETMGVKPVVSSKWHNGNFEKVTVTFRHPPGKPLDELAGAVREAVTKEFKATPDKIVLAFEFGK